MNELVQLEIDRIVNKYPFEDSKDLFRSELEYLVILTEREELKKQLDKLNT